MNSKGEENRSVRLTRKRLSDALITLLMQKPVREITVRELTELANVSRGTFYFHYTDIYDLMDHVEREQIHTLELLMDDILPRLEEDSTRKLCGRCSVIWTKTMVFAVYCWAQMGILHLCTG